MTLVILKELCELEKAAPIWDTHFPTLASPMQHYAWMKACAESFDLCSTLHVLMLEDHSRPIAIAPLFRKQGFLSVFAQIGVTELHEPCDFIYEDFTSLLKLTKELADKKIPLSLARVPESSPLLQALKSSYRGRGLVLCKSRESCPYIKLGNGPAELEGQLSSRLRSDLRRALRKSEGRGRVSFEIHSPITPEDFLLLFEEILRIESAGWKGYIGTALGCDHLLRTFYRTYGLRAVEKGILRICFMRINDQAVAMQLAIESGLRFWLLKIGFDESFAECSPGSLLMLETLRYANGKGLHSYEFLGTSAPWTRRWTKDERPTVAIRSYPYSVAGLLIFLRDCAEHFYRKLWTH